LGVVLVLILAACGPSHAATYYLDSVNGNDSRSGTSEAQAWKTIAKVNTIGRNGTVYPGDTVLFKRGGIWRETLTLFDLSGGKQCSGNAQNPITFGAYGTGAKPVISGADPVTGWTAYGGNVWQASLPWTPIPSGPTPQVVFFDGERGANKASLAALNTEKDWYWVSGYLYVYAPSNPSARYAAQGVEVATRNYCIWGVYGANADYIHIQDLELRESNHKNILMDLGNDYWVLSNLAAHHNGPVGNGSVDANSIHINAGIGHLVTGCAVYQSGENNINVLDSSNVVIEKCASFDANHHCIDMKGGITGRACQNNIVRYNTVYLSAGFSSPYLINGIFIGLNNSQPLSNTLIHDNVVFNLGDCGIQIDQYPNGTSIYNNVVCNSGVCDYYIFNDGTVVIKNNIAVNTGASHINLRVYNTAGKTIDYNCWRVNSGTFAAIGSNYTTYSNWTTYRSQTGFDAHSTNANPLFIDAAAHDYHLQGTSPCRDTGANVGLTQDFDGVPVPQGSAVDIGAFEFYQSLTITQQPQGGQSYQGGSFTFTVATSGGLGTISYQWQKDGVDIPGATRSSYTIGLLTLGDTGHYTVIVTDSYKGLVISNPATLVVLGDPLTITQQPVGGMATAGGSFAFVVHASGGIGDLSYEWRRNGRVIAVVTDSWFIIPFVTFEDAGPYTVTVSDGYAEVVSDPAILTVTGSLPATDLEGFVLLLSAITGSGLYVLRRKGLGGRLSTLVHKFDDVFDR
jgi:hypothetical protein